MRPIKAVTTAPDGKLTTVYILQFVEHKNNLVAVCKHEEELVAIACIDLTIEDEDNLFKDSEFETITKC